MKTRESRFKYLHYIYSFIFTTYFQCKILPFRFRSGFFIRRRPKNSRAQKLKLKKFFAKTQAIFSKKLKKPENVENLFALHYKYIMFMCQISPKNVKIWCFCSQNSRNFQKLNGNSRIFRKLKAKIAIKIAKTQDFGNSTYQPCRKNASKT